MSDPISDIIDENPTPAEIYLTGASAAYNPRTGVTFDEGPGFPVVGSMRNNIEQKLGADVVALFLVKKDDFPAGTTADASWIKVSGEKFRIAKIRKRYWEGQLNGYLLGLAQ